MRSAVVVFPGSNCDRDVEATLRFMDVGPVDMVWHDEESFPEKPDLVILPGPDWGAWRAVHERA